MKAIKHWN